MFVTLLSQMEGSARMGGVLGVDAPRAHSGHRTAMNDLQLHLANLREAR